MQAHNLLLARFLTCIVCYACVRDEISFGHYEECPSSCMQRSVLRHSLSSGMALYTFSEHSDNRLPIRTGHISTFETAADRRLAPARGTTHSFRLTESIYATGQSLICESAPNDVTFCSRALLLLVFV